LQYRALMSKRSTPAAPDVAAGTLYVVATPIGNLEDLSARALRVLEEVDGILAEDTRVSRRLLDRHGIGTPVASLHAHNERGASRQALARLLSGDDLALVSDAGTPLLSDPGLELVRTAREAGVTLRPVPGPSAPVTALSVSGLPASRFWFEGFLPPRPGARRARLQELRLIAGTLVFFEAPHRMLECLQDCILCFGEDTPAAFARELTKLHEEVCQDSLGALQRRLQAQPPRGEFVLLVDNPGPPEHDEARLTEVLQVLVEHLPLKQAAAVAAQLCGARRNRAYELALQLKVRS
jgi:16S rRNA (cytidine1402-2'-O)-methyltransferase